MPLPVKDDTGGAESRYRSVAARFLRDGILSSDEENTLAHLADDLGIAAGRAHDLRIEARRMPPSRPTKRVAR